MLYLPGDYTDIRERVRRDGRLDTDDLWEPHSGDSYEAFCGRHGTWAFGLDWQEMQARERGEHLSRRDTGRARLAQESWEAAQRLRQQAKQAQADREWQEAEVARQAAVAARKRLPLQLQVLADDALQYFLAARAPVSPGHQSLGALCSRVQMPRAGGLMNIAMHHLLAEIPPDASLSAHPFEMLPGTVGANATNSYASLRVTLSPSGDSLYFDVTWDSA